MRIAHVCPNFYPYIGGVETHVKQVSERLAKKGFEVEVLTTVHSKKQELPREEIINGVVVKRFISLAPGEAYYFSNDLKRYLDENSSGYDVLHAHSYHAFPSLYAALAKGENRLLFTPHYHGTGHTLFRSLLHVPYKYLGKKIFKKADRIVCVSNYEKGLITSNFDLDEGKIIVIPNGVNLEEFRGLTRMEKNYETILYVGRLEKYKGIQYLIEVLPLLESDVILEIVGKGSYKENLVNLARKLNVTERVKFFQDLPRSELLQKYVDADVFVLLSKHEAYGLSVAEALCAGTPCVVANTSALTEWVDGKNCFGIDYPIDLNILAELIQEVAGKSVSKPAAILDWNQVTDRLVKLYMDLVSG